MTWFKQLKFKTNPLDVRPNSNLVGLETPETRLKNHILKEEICFLNGLTGSGKTSLLMKLQKDMKKHKFIYLDAHDLPQNFNLQQELKNKKGFFDKLWLRNYPKKTPVLIIDEFQATDPNLVLEARAKWEDPNNKRIRSIVVSQISKHLKNVTPSFKERLGSRLVVLDTLDEDELKQILKIRLVKRKKNYADKFSDEALSFLVRCSGGNPRRLLEYADEVFDFHHRKFKDRNPLLLKNYMISYHGTREILGLGKVHVEGFEHLDERKSVIRDTIQMTNGVDLLNKKYNQLELKLLRYFKGNPKTIEQVARRFKVSESTASRYIRGLATKKALLIAGKKKNKKQWQISPQTKRLMVKV